MEYNRLYVEDNKSEARVRAEHDKKVNGYRNIAVFGSLHEVIIIGCGIISHYYKPA